MNATLSWNFLPSAPRRRSIWLAIAALVILVLGLLWLRPAKTDQSATAYHEVKRGDFTVSVVEGGALAAVNEVSIRSEVEGVARIISIAPEGSYVRKGELLVELDSAQAQDQVNQQQISYERAKFAVEQSRAQLDIAKSATNSDFLAADLKLKFARIDLDKYEQGQRLVDLVEASNRLVQAQAQLSVNLDSYSNSVKLAAKGYETKQRADADWLSVLGNRNSVIVASNGIWMLERFDIAKQRDKFKSDVLQAEQELDRVVSQNKRKMAQYEADLTSQQNTLVLSEQKLARDRKNLAATKILAPQDGLVVYPVSDSHFSSESLIEGGAIVRNRQELIKLPDLSRMKITVKVHESHISMVRPGLPASVKLQPMPDLRFAGVVYKVAPLPDTQARWGNPNLKVYNTEVHIIDPLPNVKPGVSAEVEIVITNIADSLSVPIQAVTTFKSKQTAYVLAGGKAEPRPVEVGLYNTKFIQVTKGLHAGDRVLLSPPFDTQPQDLEGAVLAGDQKARFATNRFAAGSGRPGDRNGGPQERGEPANGAALASNGADDGAPAGDGSGPPGRGTRRGMSREDRLRMFDKDGDGQLNESEMEAMRTALAARFGGERGPGSRGGPRRQVLTQGERLKRFDKNGDGKLDEAELAAMREALAAEARSAENGADAGGGATPPGERRRDPRSSD